MRTPRHKDQPKVEKTDTGFNVDFGDLLVSIGTDQAKTEKQAVEAATKIYKETNEGN